MPPAGTNSGGNNAEIDKWSIPRLSKNNDFTTLSQVGFKSIYYGSGFDNLNPEFSGSMALPETE